MRNVLAAIRLRVTAEARGGIVRALLLTLPRSGAGRTADPSPTLETAQITEAEATPPLRVTRSHHSSKAINRSRVGNRRL